MAAAAKIGLSTPARSTSREIRVPGGKSSGFPIAKRAFGP
jgi:hypothetical protein